MKRGVFVSQQATDATVTTSTESSSSTGQIPDAMRALIIRAFADFDIIPAEDGLLFRYYNIYGDIVLTVPIDDIGSDPGADGKDGKSAYELAVDSGFSGTLVEWLKSLKGKDGESVYQTWLNAGHVGTPEEFFAYLIGPIGPKGDPFRYSDFTPEQLAQLKGPAGSTGADGRSAFQIWLDAGNTGSPTDFLNSLTGPAGAKGDPFRYSDFTTAQLAALKGSDGAAATVEAGTVTMAVPGTEAKVTNVGTASAAKFNFTIPRAADGTPAKISSVSIELIASDLPARVENKGTEQDAKLSFYIPKPKGINTDNTLTLAEVIALENAGQADPDTFYFGEV